MTMHARRTCQVQLIPCRQKEIVLYLRQNEKQVLACSFFDERVRVTGLTENGRKIVRSITKQQQNNCLCVLLCLYSYYHCAMTTPL